MTKILHLTLKKRWFDMIASGEKRVEYREIKPYWTRRLTGFFTVNALLDHVLHKTCDGLKERKDYTVIQFKNGYNKNAPTILIEYKNLTVQFGKAEWGAPNTNVFNLHLGKILKINR